MNLFRISLNIFELIWVHSILEISEACLKIILSINWINSVNIKDKIMQNPFLSQSYLNLHWSRTRAPQNVAPVAASPSVQQQQKARSQQFRKNPKPRSKILHPQNRWSEDFKSSSESHEGLDEVKRCDGVDVFWRQWMRKAFYKMS